MKGFQMKRRCRCRQPLSASISVFAKSVVRYLASWQCWKSLSDIRLR
jgi:hypothetical protein